MKSLLVAFLSILSMSIYASDCLNVSSSNVHSQACFSELPSNVRVSAQHMYFSTKAGELSASDFTFYLRETQDPNRCEWEKIDHFVYSYISKTTSNGMDHWFILKLHEYLTYKDTMEMLVRIECLADNGRCFSYNIAVLGEDSMGLYIKDTPPCFTEVSADMLVEIMDRDVEFTGKVEVTPNPAKDFVKVTLNYTDFNTGALDQFAMDAGHGVIDIFAVKAIDGVLVAKTTIKPGDAWDISRMAAGEYKLVVFDMNRRLLGTETLIKR